ncbi:MAG TPA: restriction endonuclease [Chloroflexota bacterium]|nr:restriction endonuclease [Chloroflexota bacterium]
MIRLTAVIMKDVNQDIPADLRINFPDGAAGYYDIPLAWFQDIQEKADFVTLYLHCPRSIPDFNTYFKCLCEIHKRRRKYERILSAQPLPKTAQISPRALLEFGIISAPALSSWMTWKKWFYDIDNRAAQETGYLFEPILAASLGGAAYGARNSPIRRRGDAKKGRQVDCVVDRLAYEFKLRVTIAASGQGRFSEELEFAQDCQAAGYKPVLLVLDPTPSHRLDDLSAEYARVDGEAYIGNAAWKHLEEQAGVTMATFVEKYVRRPIAEVDAHASELLNLCVRNLATESAFTVQLFNAQGDDYQWRISRQEDQALTLSDEEGSGDDT